MPLRPIDVNTNPDTWGTKIDDNAQHDRGEENLKKQNQAEARPEETEGANEPDLGLFEVNANLITDDFFFNGKEKGKDPVDISAMRYDQKNGLCIFYASRVNPDTKRREDIPVKIEPDKRGILYFALRHHRFEMIESAEKPGIYEIVEEGKYTPGTERQDPVADAVIAKAEQTTKKVESDATPEAEEEIGTLRERFANAVKKASDSFTRQVDHVIKGKEYYNRKKLDQMNNEDLDSIAHAWAKQLEDDVYDVGKRDKAFTYDDFFNVNPVDIRNKDPRLYEQLETRAEQARRNLRLVNAESAKKVQKKQVQHPQLPPSPQEPEQPIEEAQAKDEVKKDYDMKLYKEYIGEGEKAEQENEWEDRDDKKGKKGTPGAQVSAASANPEDISSLGRDAFNLGVSQRIPFEQGVNQIFPPLPEADASEARPSKARIARDRLAGALKTHLDKIKKPVVKAAAQEDVVPVTVGPGIIETEKTSATRTEETKVAPKEEYILGRKGLRKVKAKPPQVPLTPVYPMYPPAPESPSSPNSFLAEAQTEELKNPEDTLNSAPPEPPWLRQYQKAPEIPATAPRLPEYPRVPRNDYGFSPEQPPQIPEYPHPPKITVQEAITTLGNGTPGDEQQDSMETSISPEWERAPEVQEPEKPAYPGTLYQIALSDAEAGVGDLLSNGLGVDALVEKAYEKWIGKDSLTERIMSDRDRTSFKEWVRYLAQQEYNKIKSEQLEAA